MYNLVGYQETNLLYSGTRTQVYRGIRISDQQPVIIKILRNLNPTFNELVQFRNQYTIICNLNSPWVVRPLGLERYGNGYALVMLDEGAIALIDYWQQSDRSLAKFLNIAIQLADTLHYLTQQRIIHKDIKPANILIHPDTQQIKLIDFSISSLLPKEQQQLINANILEGTLAYISPEQTGRMNRGIDYRTDFYSLGVSFYELLTGKLPFENTDPVELIYSHIAKKPDPLEREGEEIPQVLSDLVLKLMAKNAEDRYQSALGLKSDLEQCLQQLKTTGEIRTFELGKRDRCDRFIIPEKLYGREQEVQTLLDAFERVAIPSQSPLGKGSGSEIMMVAGFSGIGKTAVINEVHKPIVRQHGYFIKGKYDQFNRNIPFFAFVQAFRDLMNQLLGESNRNLVQWKTKILKAVGENGQVIIDVIPELEHIIGKQSPVPELSGSAAQNRFNLVFSQFVSILTTKEHPLVIFLDDLQWADSASLNLLKLLINELQTGYLLVLGAYRDNEVFPAHPLMLILNQIQKQEATINTLTLTPLSKADITRLVADTLLCSTKIAEPLSVLVYQKTQGNPFFTTQFLKGLYEDGWITFNSQSGYWQCDLTQIRQLALTDNVVKFMVGRLQKLPQKTQDVLKLAACIGNYFNLEMLSVVCNYSQDEVAINLWRALQEGFVIPQSQSYKFFQGNENQDDKDKIENISVSYRFLHDRVQQAAYSLIPEEQKQLTHWNIGQLLLQQLSQPQQEEQIFEIVNHLNLGKDMISHPAQHQQLTQLNLKAGEKAKLSAAYQAAQNYFLTGLHLLPREIWPTNYSLIYQLYRYGSEAAYLCGNFEQAEALYPEAIYHAQTPLDKAVIYRVQMTQYHLQGRNAEAISIQLQSLQLLGWKVPESPEDIQASLDEQIEIVRHFLEQQTIESILELPKMTDESIAEMLRILQILHHAAWLDGQTTLSLLAVAKMTTLSLKYGNSDMSPFGYVGYGMIATVVLKNFGRAYQFGKMAVQLCEQFEDAGVRGMTNFLFAADVHSWSRPLREAETYYENAYKYGMEAGDWLIVSFMMMQSGSDRLTYGKNLDELYAIVQTHADFLRRVKSLENLDALVVGVLQPVRQLLGLTKTPFSFDDESFSEAKYLQKYQNTPFHLAWFYSVKIRHAYLFNQQATYSELIPKLSIIENTIATHAKVPSSVFYVILMHLALIETADNDAERQHHWQAIIPLEERLNLWQQSCPENIHHKCLLIQAEKARLSNKQAEAIDLYEQAIAQAKAQDYGYEEALANELAAKFYLNWNFDSAQSKGKEKVGAGYMQEAYYCYARWGAKAKIDDLEKCYPNLLQPILQQVSPSLNPLETLVTIAASKLSIDSSTTRTSSSNSINTALDFAALLKASQALSGIIQLDELLHQLSQIILQNSGADRGCFILPNQAGEWYINAITTPDKTELCSQPLEDNPHLPVKLIQYVKNTEEVVVINDFKTDIPLIDQYFSYYKPKSIFCLPLLNQNNLIGILYLENHSTNHVFTEDRILVINFLCTQAAISLENARLYRQEQEKLEQLEEKNHLLAFQSIVSHIAARNENLSAMLQQFCQTIVDQLDAAFARIWILRPTENLLELKASAGMYTHINGGHQFVPVGKFKIGLIAEEKEAHLTNDVLNDPRVGDHEWARREGMVSFAGYPLMLGSELLGVVAMFGRDPLSDAVLASLKVVATEISLGIRRKHLETSVEQKARALENTLTELQQAQLQRVQSEKMATLGNLVSGVAHEINNPLGFLNGSINNANEYVQDLLGHLKLYQEHYPNAVEVIQENAEDIDLEFLREDLPKLLESMQTATDRIRNISISLRSFSRTDTENKVSADLHEGLDSTLLLLKYRLKASENRSGIKVIKEYGELPPILSFPGQLNQVFMNLLANAIDAFDEGDSNLSNIDKKGKSNRIKIRTSLLNENQVQIQIEDNGYGMNEETRARIFEQGFTTKGVGKGTGLGMAIAHQIITEKHGGTITCDSTPGKGTLFTITLPTA
ncbi:MAG: AAA family ATPase [Cyanobacteria bacterium J06592_8]